MILHHSVFLLGDVGGSLHLILWHAGGIGWTESLAEKHISFQHRSNGTDVPLRYPFLLVSPQNLQPPARSENSTDRAEQQLRCLALNVTNLVCYTVSYRFSNSRRTKQFIKPFRLRASVAKIRLAGVIFAWYSGICLGIVHPTVITSNN
jgi:hypothetical protein